LHIIRLEKKVTVHLSLVAIGHLNKISTVHYFFSVLNLFHLTDAAAATASLQVTCCSQPYTACTKRADYNNNNNNTSSPPPPVYRACIYLLFFYYNFFLFAYSTRMVSTGPVDRLRRVTGYTDAAAVDICAWFRIGGAWGTGYAHRFSPTRFGGLPPHRQWRLSSPRRTKSRR